MKPHTSTAAGPIRADALRAWLGELQRYLGRRGWRELLLLTGERAAVYGLARSLLPESDWLPALPGADGLARGRRLLGQSRERLVFDLWRGFDPDLFAAAAGALAGGGVCLLLAPPLARWDRFDDPFAARLATPGLAQAAVARRFLRRCARLLDAAPAGVRVIDCDRPLPVLPKAETGDAAPPEWPSPAQRGVIEAVAKLVRTPAGALVLTADRGRGKSTALGLAAAALAGKIRVRVTAPRRSATDALYAALAREAVAAEQAAFCAPDRLLREGPGADLLLIDEAAAIPVPMLRALLERYPRCVFATTVHGYEGSGRGFALRFSAELDRRRPGWRHLHLDTPLRWAADDPLEPLLNRLLVMDAEPASVSSSAVVDVEWAEIDRERLADDDALLDPVFGLLVLAHYRTRPFDLRLLLDAPGMRVFALRGQGRVPAVALVAEEGGFPESLAEAVFMGRRRARGHLLPQSLAMHLGVAEAPRLRCARVLRIAVLPELQRRGMGQRLVAGIRDALAAEGVDLFGVAFGASEGLVRFWQAARMQPLRLGRRAHAATDRTSLLAAQALTPAGERVLAQALREFRRSVGEGEGFDPEAAGDWLRLVGLAWGRRNPQDDAPLLAAWPGARGLPGRPGSPAWRRALQARLLAVADLMPGAVRVRIPGHVPG